MATVSKLNFIFIITFLQMSTWLKILISTYTVYSKTGKQESRVNS